MTMYTIEPERRTLHGKFSREHEPVLTIEPGDTVRFRTLDAGWGLEAHDPSGAVPRRTFEPFVPETDSGHALCGPVFIRGAEPGMALEVHIDHLRSGAYGWTVAGGWRSVTNERLGVADGAEHYLYWTLDPDAMTGRDQYGHTVTLRPFMGVMGLPPDESGLHDTAPPRFCGGNIDCKELVQGTSLYLPITVPGALFSTGDGHGAQGDGEAGGTAIECPMEVAELTFHLHPTMRLTTPRARTDEGWLTFGFHESLDEAMSIALDAMLGLMGEQHGLSRRDALAMTSVVVDLRVTQVVNGVRGVHAVLPHGALR